jgi:hypothetical protein
VNGSFAIRWTPEASGQYAQLRAVADSPRFQPAPAKPGNEKGLFKQVHKCLSLLAENPRHPGLRTHVFVSCTHPFDANQKVFVAYAQNRTPAAYRVFWCYGPGVKEMTVIAITPHH